MATVRIALSVCFYGAGGRIRTDDLLITNRSLFLTAAFDTARLVPIFQPLTLPPCAILYGESPPVSPLSGDSVVTQW
jgi:hypothetical protein